MTPAAYTPEMAGAAADRGIAWLDANHPGWLAHVNLDTLDVGSPVDCPAGQCARHILGRAENEIGMAVDYFDVVYDNEKTPLGLTKAARLGFTIPARVWWKKDKAAWEAALGLLTAAWKKRIGRRLGRAA